MNLKEYFADIDENNQEPAQRLEELVAVCATIPINHCLVCCFDDNELQLLKSQPVVEASFDECVKAATIKADYGKPVYIVIRSNGKLFLENVGTPYGFWTKAYKMLGYNIFVLGSQDDF